MSNLLRTLKIAGFMAIAGMGSAALAQTADCSKDGSGAITSMDTCYVEPNEYYMTIYKMGLCTAQPGTPTSSVAADFSSCTTVFENSAGSRIKAVKGVSSNLTGTMTRPANGTYTHGYVLAAPQFEIKTKHTFSTPRAAAGDLLSPPRHYLLEYNRHSLCIHRSDKQSGCLPRNL